MSIEELYAGRGESGNLSPEIDIIAVHGLNPINRADHGNYTWLDPKSGHLWLRDALPFEQPTARVLLYSYNSSPAFGAGQDRFIHQASSLLERLKHRRIDDPDRPVIWISHSLGGILIKQALVNAHNNPKYTPIKDATFGLMFFGTPHEGPTIDAKVRFGRVCVDIAQTIPGNPSNDIMEALKKGSPFSDMLQEHFRHQLERYQIVSFYEGIGNLVPRSSAMIGLPGTRETIVSLNASHRKKCRFNPAVQVDRENYDLVKNNIADLCEGALRINIVSKSQEQAEIG